MAFVYKITSPSGRIYIGSTNAEKVETRWNHYRNKNCSNQKKLLNSLNKYGYNNHKLEVIWQGDISDMYKMESQYGIEFEVLDNKKGLNCCLPKGNTPGYTVSEETKEKIRAYQLGRPKSQETRDKMRIYAKKRGISPEMRLILSKARKGIGSRKEKKVICTKTGKIFLSVLEAAPYSGYSKSWLATMLRGHKPNTTSLIYLKDEKQNKISGRDPDRTT